MVEGARLLSGYTVKSRIVGSNPILSATSLARPRRARGRQGTAKIPGNDHSLHFQPSAGKGIVWLPA